MKLEEGTGIRSLYFQVCCFFSFLIGEPFFGMFFLTAFIDWFLLFAISAVILSLNFHHPFSCHTMISQQSSEHSLSEEIDTSWEK